jgi:multidrug transporter EmrE-like cation transporter
MRTLTIGGLTLANLAFTVVSNTGLKLSATSRGWQGFLWWQIVGNLSGFLGVLAFTFLLRFISLHLAYALTAGLGFLCVQIIAARFIFQEPISTVQWLGTALTAVGIIIISWGK